MSQLKISARNAGLAALEKYCPRCCWYLLRIKRWPFQFGMPGIMFYLERAQKAFILAYLAQHDRVPKYFGPFADCTEPVDFPHVMEQLHSDTDVIVSARADMMLRKKNGTICLLDLKTSKPDGGGKVFLPQYEIQVIGYSWVTEAAKVGKVGSAGLLYCDMQVDEFIDKPLQFKTEKGIVVPFVLTPHEVSLDYSRFTKCLKEMNKLWNATRPPQGADGCKDCGLLTRAVDFENELRMNDQQLFAAFPECRNAVVSQDFFRRMTRLATRDESALLDARFDVEGGMWANWEIS